MVYQPLVEPRAWAQQRWSNCDLQLVCPAVSHGACSSCLHGVTLALQFGSQSAQVWATHSMREKHLAHGLAIPAVVGLEFSARFRVLMMECMPPAQCRWFLAAQHWCKHPERINTLNWCKKRTNKQKVENSYPRPTKCEYEHQARDIAMCKFTIDGLVLYLLLTTGIYSVFVSSPPLFLFCLWSWNIISPELKPNISRLQ